MTKTIPFVVGVGLLAAGCASRSVAEAFPADTAPSLEAARGHQTTPVAFSTLDKVRAGEDGAHSDHASHAGHRNPGADNSHAADESPGALGDHSSHGRRSSHTDHGGKPAAKKRAAASGEATLKSTSSSGGTYSCPMHPEIVSDKPGSCSICGMHLEPQK